jgi:threonylcarbamoyladenosine tRNA methylthiotransferase MtaB
MGDRVIALPGGRKQLLLELPALLSSAARGELLDFMREKLGAADAGVAEACAEAAARGDAANRGEGPFAFKPDDFVFHSRPSLKVEDGCDNACAYCRVRIARGRATSLPAREALERARALEAAGRAEIVLAGVNLSQYRDGDTDFPGLLRVLLAGTSRIAFRISSYEPDKLDGAFLEAFAEERVRPHVHLALQSGSDAVLKAMGRRYCHADILHAVRELRRVKRDPFLAADIIAGFPGESEADAEATLALVRDCDFAWIHAFRFSPRPGTKAISMPNRVPERVAGERAAALLELGREGRERYRGRWYGKEVRAVIESDFCATSVNYLKLRLEGLPGNAMPGQEIRCRIQSAQRIEASEEIDACASYMSVATPSIN